MGALAKRMVEKAGLPIEVHLTLDRREALKDADFVTTQFRVGLLEALAKDERIRLNTASSVRKRTDQAVYLKAFGPSQSF